MVCLNLVKQSERRPRESRLGEEYWKAIGQLNQQAQQQAQAQAQAPAPAPDMRGLPRSAGAWPGSVSDSDSPAPPGRIEYCA